MNSAPTPSWRVTGIGWGSGGARLEWADMSGAQQTTALELGSGLSFVFGEDRRCIGIWRSGRRIACSIQVLLPASGRSSQCADCHAMERSNSIATDTRLDDPRQFSVYLAHHGSVVKVGITAADRGEARLLEQGALASAFISTGSLLGARRIENLLITNLGLPDRVSTVRKRKARVEPGTVAERAARLREVAGRIADLEWPEGQERREVKVSDHAASYGLTDEGLYADVELRTPTPGSVISGRIVCTIGPDVYVETAGGLALVDTHVLSGWALGRAPADAVQTVPLDKLEPPPRRDEQEALF
ncbi:DUF2797 domain-containing protein [Kribbella sp. NPDC056861]|uniref:DUF2797 domain-containing protein n=1 Tax=Kribbella sp. NPDC056861 TaxID=3154857 RepID=UPI00343E72AC